MFSLSNVPMQTHFNVSILNVVFCELGRQSEHGTMVNGEGMTCVEEV